MLAQCLQSIIADCGPKGRASAAARTTIEVFVVDNASSDGSVQMVKERFPWVRLIENAENLGFARANNQAIDLAQRQVHPAPEQRHRWCIPARLQR